MARVWRVLGCGLMVACGGPSSGAGADDAEGTDDGEGSNTVAVTAPDTVEELLPFLLEHTEDPAALEAGVAALRPLLGSGDPVQLQPLDQATADRVDHPDADLDDLVGMAVFAGAEHSPEDHATHVAASDQTVVYEGYVSYDRVAVDADAGELLAGSGTHTYRDEVVVEDFVFVVDYELDTVVAWAGEAMVVRTTLPEAACSEEGESCLDQSFALRVYAPEGRVGALWSTTSSSLVTIDEETQRRATVSTLEDLFDAQDAFLD